MVRSISTVEFAKEFEKKVKENTVWVYIHDGYTEVFSSLKFAKQYSARMAGDKDITWKCNANRSIWLGTAVDRAGVEENLYYTIQKKRIVRC